MLEKNLYDEFSAAIFYFPHFANFCSICPMIGKSDFKLKLHFIYISNDNTSSALPIPSLIPLYFWELGEREGERQGGC